MKGKHILTLMATVVLSLGLSQAWAQFPSGPLTWTTYLTRNDVISVPGVGDVTVGNMEGLTGDNNGILYVADRGVNDGGSDPTNADTCHVWRINTNTGDVDLVGQITDTCRPSGLTFDANGDLFITSGVDSGTNDGGSIYQLTPNVANPTGASATGSEYATGVPGANGVAFDRNGNLLVTDGTRAWGSVWRVSPGGGNCATATDCEELFRVPPRRNGTNLGGNVTSQPDGVGAVRYTVPRHDTGAPSATDRQDIVANGVAIDTDGTTILVADTSNGALWVVKTKPNGDLRSSTGCDPTLSANTLCMDSLYIAHPLLQGADGIALLHNGTILADANERNAIVAITKKKVVDAFRNAVDATTLLRNGNDTNARPLDAPSSPFVSGKKFCTTNADFPRRDNNPSMFNHQKVACLDQNIHPAGLPLPVH